MPRLRASWPSEDAHPGSACARRGARDGERVRHSRHPGSEAGGREDRRYGDSFLPTHRRACQVKKKTRQSGVSPITLPRARAASAAPGAMSQTHRVLLQQPGRRRQDVHGFPDGLRSRSREARARSRRRLLSVQRPDRSAPRGQRARVLRRADEGLQVTVDVTTRDTRAEGLIRDLEHAPAAMDCDEDRPRMPARSSALSSRANGKAARGRAGRWTTTRYALRPRDHNPPPAPVRAYPARAPVLLGGYAGPRRRLRRRRRGTFGATRSPRSLCGRVAATVGGRARARARADDVAALPGDFGAVFMRTDHLAACVLTALRRRERVVRRAPFLRRSATSDAPSGSRRHRARCSRTDGSVAGAPARFALRARGRWYSRRWRPRGTIGYHEGAYAHRSSPRRR